MSISLNRLSITLVGHNEGETLSRLKNKTYAEERHTLFQCTKSHRQLRSLGSRLKRTQT